MESGPSVRWAYVGNGSMAAIHHPTDHGRAAVRHARSRWADAGSPDAAARGSIHLAVQEKDKPGRDGLTLRVRRFLDAGWSRRAYRASIVLALSPPATE